MRKMSKKKVLRLTRFLERLAKGRVLTHHSFQRYLYEVDVTENIDIMCSTRTLRRDLAYLRNELHAPVHYSEEDHTFVMDDRSWYQRVFQRLAGRI